MSTEENEVSSGGGRGQLGYIRQIIPENAFLKLLKY